MKVSIDPKYRQALTFQSYDKPPAIDGVFFHPLKRHDEINGSFMELIRLAGGRIEGLDINFDAQQISISSAQGERINAFHLHCKEVQDELWCVLAGTLLVNLVDVRENSKTVGVVRRCVLADRSPGLLHIPAGVAHGYKAGPDGATLAYIMNNRFNIEDPNEGRLPWDHFGKELWQDDRG